MGRRAVRDIPAAILNLLDRQESISTREVVDALDGEVSRQWVHHHLDQMVESGELIQLGHGKATRYQRVLLALRRYDTRRLSEDAVWRELRATVPILEALSGSARDTLAYVFTEMLNNAIDHSGSETVTIRVMLDAPHIVIDVDDEGIGVFANISNSYGGTLVEAAQRLTLGKVTTAAEAHTGEGIFFSSRAVDLFAIQANGLRWLVDNDADDWALGELPHRQGTLVRFKLDPAHARPLAELFDQYTRGEGFRFDTTEAVIKLLDFGVTFVSRSEAKRLAVGLEPFDHIVLDFTGVTAVGQGFVDQLFRVWAKSHPEKQLEWRGANDAVRFMIERGLPRQ